MKMAHACHRMEKTEGEAKSQATNFIKALRTAEQMR